eukprot:TRINITY_DN9503_c0_g1_i1.p1 TRINITY_DN9503_c0_g1~~TRINITY_DN9503_c0_g1_i1.p1  ORF type:complete len:236 (+),score=43.06 TRINITY_DN9503_c0_g1_i1:3-710(+)
MCIRDRYGDERGDMSEKNEVLSHVRTFSVQSRVLIQSVILMGEGKSLDKYPEEVMKELLDTHENLLQSLQKLREKQSVYNKILELKKRIEDKDRQILLMAAHLKGIEKRLQIIVDKTKTNDVQLKERLSVLTNGTIDVEDIVNYSHLISGTSCGWYIPLQKRVAGNLFHPYPRDDEMQDTALYQELSKDLQEEQKPEEVDIKNIIAEEKKEAIISWDKVPDYYETTQPEEDVFEL